MWRSTAWEKWFPKGYGHTSITFLRRCLGFKDAKAGNIDAARFVVRRCVKQERLCELRERYPDAILLPVLGQNKLPLALAQAIGLPIWLQVRLVHTVSRKVLNAIQRLMHKPVFTGYIRHDMEYIIVDDVITQGGTVAALREFVLVRGGRVVAVVALAYAIGSHAVAPLKKHIVRLIVKFGMPLIFLLRAFKIATGFWELTNSQAKYLRCFASLENIRKRLRGVCNHS